MTLGRIAYDAYCKEREWKSFNGEQLPHFEQQSPELQRAWEKAAQAVAEDIRNKTSQG